MALKIVQETLTPQEEQTRIADTEIPKEGKVLVELVNQNMYQQVKMWEVVKIRRKDKGIGVKVICK